MRWFIFASCITLLIYLGFDIRNWRDRIDRQPILHSQNGVIELDVVSVLNVEREFFTLKTRILEEGHKVLSTHSFKEHDVLSLRIVKKGDYYHVIDFHLWQEHGYWYLKVLLSLFPTIWVFFLLKKNFLIDWKRLEIKSRTQNV